MTEKRYTIKEGRDEGFGRFSLYCDGEWLETFHTREGAEAEQTHRKQFDLTRRETHA